MPALQKKQTVKPAPDAYEPELQLLQVEAAAALRTLEYVPALQRTQTVWPMAEAKVPALQLEQADTIIAPEAVEKVPVTQAVQIAAVGAPNAVE